MACYLVLCGSPWYLWCDRLLYFNQQSHSCWKYKVGLAIIKHNSIRYGGVTVLVEVLESQMSIGYKILLLPVCCTYDSDRLYSICSVQPITYKISTSKHGSVCIHPTRLIYRVVWE